MKCFKKSWVLIALVFTILHSQNSNAQTGPKGVKNIVLIHGAFADGSCWSKVIPQLHAKGYNVIAVQNPLTSLAADVAAANRAIAQMEGPVLLVAHSFGGIIMSEAGKDPKVAGLVYVAALVPDEGQSGNDVNAAMPTTGIEKEFLISADGYASLSKKAVAEYFAPDVTLAEKKLIYTTQVHLSAAEAGEKVNNPAWKTKPSWFIVAAQDRVINPDLERARAKMINATTMELKSSHVPMLSRPGKVTAFIISAAEKL